MTPECDFKEEWTEYQFMLNNIRGNLIFFLIAALKGSSLQILWQDWKFGKALYWSPYCFIYYTYVIVMKIIYH